MGNTTLGERRVQRGHLHMCTLRVHAHVCCAPEAKRSTDVCMFGTVDLGVLDGKTMEQSLAAAMARPHRLSPRTRAHTDTHTHTLLPMHTCMVLSLSCAAGNGQHASPVQLDACVCWKKVPCGYVTKDAPNVCKTPKGCIGANATKDASQWC
mmetsp:Transcript_8712/g.23423  ORF Transcript_8712/g.23423 Transcript_8712/m.23423 type:complete len:152 (-) Transcript_8712:1945-2400(-)